MVGVDCTGDEGEDGAALEAPVPEGALSDIGEAACARPANEGAALDAKQGGGFRRLKQQSRRGCRPQ